MRDRNRQNISAQEALANIRKVLESVTSSEDEAEVASGNVIIVPDSQMVPWDRWLLEPFSRTEQPASAGTPEAAMREADGREGGHRRN